MATLGTMGLPRARASPVKSRLGQEWADWASPIKSRMGPVRARYLGTFSLRHTNVLIICCRIWVFVKTLVFFMCTHVRILRKPLYDTQNMKLMKN